MEKELEELSKTTDILKEFKSRVGQEDKTEDIEQLMDEWKRKSSNSNQLEHQNSLQSEIALAEEVKKSNMDIDNMIDDTTLELSDIELDNTVVLEDNNQGQEKIISNNLINVVEPLFINKKSELELDEELKDGLIRRQQQKRYGLRLMLIVLIFIPILITLITIGQHSNELISKNMVNILYILMGLCSGIFLIGSVLYIKNMKVIFISTTSKLFKYIYMFFMVTYILCCTTLLFLLYGPITDFKDWLVTTAMATKDHQYYCTWFYSKKEIDEVFSRNFIQEPEGITDDKLVNVNASKEDDEYANEYDREVLTKDEGNDLYKIINFEVNGCKAYLAVIYDPSKIRITTTDKIGVRGQYVTTMAKREKAKVAINGAGFYDPGYTSSGGSPKGITIVNGKIVTNNEYGKVKNGGLIGFTNDNKLVLLKDITAKEALQMGVRDAVSWGPYLIVNGKAAYTKGNGGWGYAARTAIGQRADGIVLLLVVDSNYNRTKGADMVDMTEIMQRYGAINASNLDGGTSSVMVVNGELISHPIDSALQNETRPIATAFIVTE